MVGEGGAESPWPPHPSRFLCSCVKSDIVKSILDPALIQAVFHSGDSFWAQEN